jgi:hypothetical protein
VPPYASAGSLGAPVIVAAAHHGWTDHVFMLPDIKFSKSNRGKKPLTSLGKKVRGWTKKRFNFLEIF